MAFSKLLLQPLKSQTNALAGRGAAAEATMAATPLLLAEETLLMMETCWPLAVRKMLPPLPEVAMMVVPVFRALTKPRTKKSLSEQNLVNERCGFTRKIGSKYALLKFTVFAQETEMNIKLSV